MIDTMEKRKNTTKIIAGTGILLAIELILQAIANVIAIGPVSLNFSAIPIALAGIVYGPLSGAILGLCSGVMVLLAPSTSFFFNESIWGTVVTCLLKGLGAGIIPSLVYLPFRKKHQYIGSFISSILVPLLNTGIFVGCCFLFFQGIYSKSQGSYATPFSFFTLGLVSWNFIFEFSTTILLTPIIYKIIKIKEKASY